MSTLLQSIRGLLKREETRISGALDAVVRSDTSTTRRELYSALRYQRMILPVPRVPENVSRDVHGRLVGTLRFEFFRSKDTKGEAVLAIFTNPEALGRWCTPPPKWIAVDTPSLCQLAIDSGIRVVAINEKSKSAVRLNEAEIHEIARLGPPSPDKTAYPPPTK